MKGHIFHVRRQMKQNNVKLKKLEARIIKIHQRISWYPFVNLVLELVLREKTSAKRRRKVKETKDQARKIWIKQLQQEYLQVTSCMYDFLAGFGVHGMCMLVFGSFFFIGMDFS